MPINGTNPAITTLTAFRILELANKAYFSYVKQTPADRRNCSNECFFELQDQRRKYHAYLQKALRRDL